MEKKEPNTYWVYIVLCSDGSLYTGSTNNVERRVEAHNEGVGAKYTRSRRPVKLVYLEECENKSLALKREIVIKKLTRKQKEDLLTATGVFNI